MDTKRLLIDGDQKTTGPGPTSEKLSGDPGSLIDAGSQGYRSRATEAHQHRMAGYAPDTIARR